MFFGGNAANAVDMRRWRSAAQQDERYGRHFAFEAIPYPNRSGEDRDPAASAGLTIRRLALGLISTPDRKVVLVGHSSGANVAAAVLSKLRDARNVRLIVLDGSLDDGVKPAPGFRRDVQLECWSATNGTLAAVNRTETMTLCTRYFELSAPKCRTAVCLHFWLVNKHAPLALDYGSSGRSNRDGSTEGYQNLQINLEWLRNAE